MIELNRQEIQDQLWDQVGNQLRIQVWKQLNNQLRYQVWNQINRVHNTILDHIEDPR